MTYLESVQHRHHTHTKIVKGYSILEDVFVPKSIFANLHQELNFGERDPLNRVELFFSHDIPHIITVENVWELSISFGLVFSQPDLVKLKKILNGTGEGLGMVFHTQGENYMHIDLSYSEQMLFKRWVTENKYQLDFHDKNGRIYKPKSQEKFNKYLKTRKNEKRNDD